MLVGAPSLHDTSGNVEEILERINYIRPTLSTNPEDRLMDLMIEGIYYRAAESVLSLLRRLRLNHLIKTFRNDFLNFFILVLQQTQSESDIVPLPFILASG